MHRIDHATRKIDANGTGKDGFTEGSPGVEDPTVVTADILNAVQEEIASVIEGAGYTLTKGDHDQLAQAIERFQYRTPPERTITIHGSAFQPHKLTPSGDGTVLAGAIAGPPIQGYRAMLPDENTALLLNLNRLLPGGCTLNTVELLMDVTADAAGALSLHEADPDWLFTPAITHTLIADAATSGSGMQVVTLSSLGFTVHDAGHIAYLAFVPGALTTGAYIPEAIRFTFTDPGPRNT